MKLIRCGAIGHEIPGVISEDGTRIDASKFCSDYDESFFANGGLNELCAWLGANSGSAPRLPHDARLGSPVARPSKIVCIRLNSRYHAGESQMEIPKEPVIFFKSTTSLVGPNDP